MVMLINECSHGYVNSEALDSHGCVNSETLDSHGCVNSEALVLLNKLLTKFTG